MPYEFKQSHLIVEQIFRSFTCFIRRKREKEAAPKLLLSGGGAALDEDSFGGHGYVGGSGRCSHGEDGGGDNHDLCCHSPMFSLSQPTFWKDFVLTQVTTL